MMHRTLIVLSLLFLFGSMDLALEPSSNGLKMPKRKFDKLETCVLDAYGKPRREEILKAGSEDSLTSGYIYSYDDDVSFERRVYLGGAFEILNYRKGQIHDGFIFLQNCFGRLKAQKPPKSTAKEFDFEYKKDFQTCFYKVSNERGLFSIVTGCQS